MADTSTSGKQQNVKGALALGIGALGKSNLINSPNLSIPMPQGATPPPTAAPTQGAVAAATPGSQGARSNG